MNKFFVSFLTILMTIKLSLSGIEPAQPSKIVTATKRIYLEEYPGAYNPSIIKFQDKYLLTFRYVPNRVEQPWISHIGIVFLDEAFEPASKIQLLDTRFYSNATPSQSEDARIFYYNDSLYVIYNDNIDLPFPSTWERRDMYVAELLYHDDQFILLEPIRLYHEAKYRETPWQKNWSPFEWNGRLLLSYMINPHEVISSNLVTGKCQHSYLTHKPIMWKHGALRGGTPAQLVDGEYLAFFHSGIIAKSPSSENRDLWHYYMGAYTFSSEPPFDIKQISSEPIDNSSFYTYSSYNKRVIYPGGFVMNGSNLYLAYGKDDSEVWIATIDVNELKKSMVPIK